MKCSFWSQSFPPSEQNKTSKKTTAQQKEMRPQTNQRKEKNQPRTHLKDKHARALPVLCRARSVTCVSAKQLHKATSYFVTKRVERHESKCKFFRALPLKLQTWQKITYGQSYRKHAAAVLNPAGLLYHNRMRLSSSRHPKNKVISCLEDNKLEGVMFKDFSLINSRRCHYPLALLLAFFRHALI